MEHIIVKISPDAPKNMTNIYLKMDKALAMTITNEALKSGALGDTASAAKYIATGMVKELEVAVYQKVKDHLDAMAAKIPETEKFDMWAAVSNEFKTWAPQASLYSNTSSNSSYTIPLSDGEHSTVTQLKKVFGALDEAVVCPVEDCHLPNVPIKLSVLIQHLNDGSHEWSREQIADWLETLDIDIKAKEDNYDD